MKKLFNIGMGLALCLGAALLTGCDEKPLDEPATGGGSGGGSTEDVRGGIEGVVTDKAAGALVSQALVELLPTDKKTQTDDLGAFLFTDLKSGTYQLRVSKTGYETYTSDDITVKSGQTVRRAISLTQELTDLRILDTADNMLSVLDLGTTRRGVFKLKNTGSTIVEWEIPTLSEEWLSFNKQSGKLAPGATDRVELTIDKSKLPLEENEAVVYIGSTVGTMQLKVRSILGHAAIVAALEASMVYVAGGTFQMGATEEQGSDASNDESPVHSVTLDGFYIGAFEVTQAQWAAVMGTTLSDIIKENGWRSYGMGDNYPMYDVSWNDAVAFCEKLSAQTGKKYRLPTEAEWEYAARGGQDADGTKYAGSNNIDEVAWYYDNSYGLGSSHPDYGTHPVGTKKANGLGIYDMSGNVWEWCSDRYGSDYYGNSPAVNPQGPSSGSGRVFRGGSWIINARFCRVSDRSGNTPDSRYSNLGFRVVCER